MSTESISNDPININLVDFFYKEILRLAVEDYSENLPDVYESSDEEPTYDTEFHPDSDDASANVVRQSEFQDFDGRSKLQTRIILSMSHYQLQKDKEISGGTLERPGTPYRSGISVISETEQLTEGDPLIPSNTSLKVRDGDSEKFIVEWYDQDNSTVENKRIRFKSGTVYCGEVVNHRFHGTGMYIWPNGVVYKGSFENGTITGFGKLIYNELSYYQGMFVDCNFEGTGSFFPGAVPVAYSGNWFRSLPHGKGHLSFSENNYYTGDWCHGKKHGNGTRVYANKAVYSGTWKNGKPSGEGSMLFSNGDYYHGEWSDGIPNGYGEYTWRAYLKTGMSYSVKSQYTGYFVNGLRDGYGVQVFGMDGSKVAALFSDNRKNGAGILICGDGTTIEMKPLFVFDHPVTLRNSENQIPRTNERQHSHTMHKISTKPRKSVSGLRVKSIINSALRESPKENTSDMYYSRSRVSNIFPAIYTRGVPLSLPLHATAKDVSIWYHVRKLLDYHHNLTQNQFNLSKMAEDNERHLLSRSIANNNVYLKKVYQQYSTLNPLHTCCPELRNPVLSRLRLWQFLRDINITKLKVSLVDIDLLLLDIPNIHLESEHDPFETIYFWQFMHCLLLLSYLQYTSSKPEENTHFKPWTYHEIFRTFIWDVVRPSEGTFKGRALFSCQDLLPIQGVYALYKTVGEPHSAKVLLNRICCRADRPVLDCFVRSRRVYDPQGPFKHFVIGGANIAYIKVREKVPWDVEEAPVLNKYSDDPFSTDLRVFRVLGSSKVVECISRVCENVKDGEDIVFIEYQITFLEFYEILINLAEELSKVKNLEDGGVVDKVGDDKSVDNVVSVHDSNVGRGGGVGMKKKKKHKVT